jgi:hypothetical protein
MHFPFSHKFQVLGYSLELYRVLHGEIIRTNLAGWTESRGNWLGNRLES